MTVRFQADIDGDGQPDIQGKLPLRLLLAAIAFIAICITGLSPQSIL